MKANIVWGCSDDKVYHLYFDGLSVCSLKLVLEKETVLGRTRDDICCPGCLSVERKLKGTMINKERDEAYMKKVWCEYND